MSWQEYSVMDERPRFVAKPLHGEAMANVWRVASQEIDEANVASNPAPPIDIAARSPVVGISGRPRARRRNGIA